MIAGVEGLALLPLLPLVWLSLPLLFLGACLALSGAAALLLRRPVGKTLLKSGAGVAAPGVVLLGIFVVAAIKLNHDAEWKPAPVKTGTFAFRFDLRTARTFEALGMTDLVQTTLSPIDSRPLQNVTIGGDITVQAIVSNRLQYQGKASLIDVEDGADDDKSLLRTIRIVTAALARPLCGQMARDESELTPAQEDELGRWLTREQTGELSYRTPYGTSPNVSLTLKDSPADTASCIASFFVIWPL
ncbi:MAG TPA: hypothetical protein VK762_19725 [Polyangiaceae bacterium]|nr:hypothetical protein [Polyangiaceae bacterium]